MRDLTEEELKLAPDWAVKFDFFNGELIYMSDVVGNYEGNPLYRFLDVKHNIEEVGAEGDYDLCTRLITKEHFDITKHEIVDYGYIGIKHDKNLYVKKSGFTIDKERAVAIAKALGVTGEDLK